MNDDFKFEIVFEIILSAIILIGIVCFLRLDFIEYFLKCTIFICGVNFIRALRMQYYRSS